MNKSTIKFRLASTLKLFSFLFFPAILLSTTFASAQQTAKSFDGTDQYAKFYLEHLPDDYNPNDGKRYPVLIALHGFGEGGNNSLSSTSNLTATGIPSLIQRGTFPESETVNGTTYKFIVISPQLNQKNLSWYTPQVDYVMKQVKAIYANKADFQRIYITGYSGGGAGAYTYPATATSSGLQVAAEVICSGAAWWQNTSDITNIVAAGLPIWAFHNSGDPVVSVTSDEGWYGALNASGMNPQMKFTIYPGVNQHDSWTRTYDPGAGNPNNIYAWLLQYSRPNITNPGSVTPSVSVPTAVAGNNQTLTLPINAATLDGSSSKDVNGTIARYAWAKVSGPAGDNLANNAQARANLTVSAAGSYTYQLTVTDNQGHTSAAQTSVQVNPVVVTAPVPPVKPPVVPPVVPPAPVTIITNQNVLHAYPGSFATIILPANSFVLDGSASVDSKGSITSYVWTKVAGPAGDAIQNNQSAKATAIYSVPGDYVYTLVVQDNLGNQSTNWKQVTVLPAGTPRANPVLVTGGVQTITLPSSSALTVTVSGEGAARVINQWWQKVSGPAGDNIIGLNKMYAPAYFVNPGVYVYKFTVMDSEGNTVSNTQQITVTGSANQNGNSQGQNEQGLKVKSRDLISAATLQSAAGATAENSLKMYPNPVTAAATIELSTPEIGTVLIQLFDLNGRLITQQHMLKTSAFYSGRYDMSAVSAGVYIVQVSMNSFQQSLKVIKN